MNDSGRLTIDALGTVDDMGRSPIAIAAADLLFANSGFEKGIACSWGLVPAKPIGRPTPAHRPTGCKAFPAHAGGKNAAPLAAVPVGAFAIDRLATCAAVCQR